MAKKLTDIRSLARVHTSMCVRVLSSIAKQTKAPASARAMACGMLLDRGWGKPHQTVSGEDGGDIKITIRKMIGGED